MGDGLTEEKQKGPTTFREVFHDTFPHYLAMGMSAADFWDGDSWLARDYREAFRIRIENEERLSDRAAWRMGEYMRSALGSVPLIVNGFKPKGVQLGTYPDKPFLEKYEEQKKEEAKKQNAEKQQQLAMAVFQAFTEKMNKGIRKRLEREKKNQKTV